MDEETTDLYDEFGNYIGPELDDDSSAASSSSSLEEKDDGDALSTTSSLSNQQQHQQLAIPDENIQQQISTTSSSIVLHEDKDHYPSASETYGPEVKTVVLDEDTMDIATEPIIEPYKLKTTSLQHESQKSVHVKGHKDTIPSKVVEERVGWDYNVSSQYYLNLFQDDNDNVSSSSSIRRRRSIAIIGDYHVGKTSFLDLMYEYSKNQNFDEELMSLDTHAGGGPRITDSLMQEQDRQCSIKSCPLSCVLQDSKEKGYLVTFVDCPGHINFHDESICAMSAVDGVMLMVDVVEGVKMHTEMLIRQTVIREGLPIILVLNKMDRLILELRLSPLDAFYKIQHVLDSVNKLISNVDIAGRYKSLSPEKGNVIFASGKHGWCMTLQSMASLYYDYYQDEGIISNMTITQFTNKLWGNVYHDSQEKTFHTHPSKTSNPSSAKRTFVEFILEPIYKLYTISLSSYKDDKSLEKVLRNTLGIKVSLKELKVNQTRTLVRIICKRFLMNGGSSSFMDVITQYIPSPIQAAKGKILRKYTGDMTSSVVKSMMACDPNGPLMIHIVKLYTLSSFPSNSSSTTSGGEANNASQQQQQSFFSAFGRIYSGTLHVNDTVSILGESYAPDYDEEDCSQSVVTGISIPQGRRRMEVQYATAGNWVLLDGIDATITKTATITNVINEDDDDEDNKIHIFQPFNTPQINGTILPVIKVAIEPQNPSELPKMLHSLRCIQKSYPIATTRVEESGEHVLFGTGELALDVMMKDLRKVYSDVEVKVSDPVVSFRETVSERSCMKVFADTPNKRNKLTFIMEPLEDGLAERIEGGKVNLNWDKKKIGKFFQTQYNYDLLSSRSVWAFGPSLSHGPNMLLDDTLPSETNLDHLQSCKNSIVQGFTWATREGPLCEEPIRNTKTKILNVELADMPIYRGGGQIIPTARRVVHSSMLLASPRLMEPIFRFEIICPTSLGNAEQGSGGSIVESAIRPLVTKRRGQIIHSHPIAGTPFSSTKVYLPVIDSFGFETDIRVLTQGQVTVSSILDHWAVVPGDPLDSGIVLHPLEPSPTQHLAREFMIKTRRRKGLSDDVTIVKYLDEEMRERLSEIMMEENEDTMEE